MAREYLGGLDISQDATWLTITSDVLKDQRSTADAAAVLASGLFFSDITINNTHATQTLFVALGAVGNAGTVTNRIPIGPGASRTVVCRDSSVSTIRVIGSGAATTGYLLATLVAR